MAGIGDIFMSSNFQLNSQRPLDARITQADIAGRDAIPLVQRYDGLEVYLEDGTGRVFKLILGTVDSDLANNNNWVDTTLIPNTTNISNFVNDANYVSSGDNISNFINNVGYLTSFTETDPTVGSHIKTITPADISIWNTAGTIATESVQGIVELADAAEITAGTDGTRAISPLRLRGTTFVVSQIPGLPGSQITSGTVSNARLTSGTTSTLGIIRLSTNSETITGTSSAIAVTPASLSARLAAGISNENPAYTSLAIDGAADYTGSILYRKNIMNQLEILITLTKNSVTVPNVATLPSGFRPTVDHHQRTYSNNSFTDFAQVFIDAGTGGITVTQNDMTVGVTYQWGMILPLN
jgi:hypothetical protein